MTHDLDTKEGFARFKIEMLEDMIPALKELKVKDLRLIEETIANAFYCGAYSQKNGHPVVEGVVQERS